MQEAQEAERPRAERREEIIRQQPLRGITLLWGEWRAKMREELISLFGKLRGAPALRGVAKTFSRVLKGLFGG
ncbi:MAG: hypothetical protein QXH27_04545 [Candidatus Micrarchaeia archaeon]